MLLPSSIHRADDFVGMAMPIVGLLCANAALMRAMVESAVSASAAIVVFTFSMLHSLCFIFRVWSCLRDVVWSLLLSPACKPDVWLAAPTSRYVQQKGAAGLRIGGVRRFVHVLPRRGNQKSRQI